MSDHSISIVPKLSTYPDKENKAKEILNWLVSLDIVKSTLSDCILSSDNGYGLSNGAKNIVNEPDSLPFGLITNGLEIITGRQIFDTGQIGVDEIICPACNGDISSEDWSFPDEWSEGSNDTTCPLCSTSTDIHNSNLRRNGDLAIWALHFGIGLR